MVLISLEKTMQNRTVKNSGLTLIEVLVAMGVFSIVISAAVGIFVSGSSSQKRIFEFNATQREAGYLMETVSRELRMATDIAASQRNNEDSSVEFTNYNKDLTRYCRSDASGNCTNNDSGDYFSREGEVISSPDIKIERLRFYVTDDFNQTQPIITISMKAKSTGQYGTELTLQNSVSLRLY